MERILLRLWLTLHFVSTIGCVYQLFNASQLWLILVPINLVTLFISLQIIHSGKRKVEMFLAAVRTEWPGRMDVIIDHCKGYLKSNFFFYCYSPLSQTLSRAYSLLYFVNLFGAAVAIWVAISQHSWGSFGATVFLLIQCVLAGKMSVKMNFPLFLLLRSNDSQIVGCYNSEYKSLALANLLINTTFCHVTSKIGIDEISANNVMGLTMRFTATINALINEQNKEPLFMFSNQAIYEPLIELMDREDRDVSVAN